MNKKVKTTKFKVINAKINKKLVGEELDLQKIKSKGGHGDGGRKPGTKNRMTLDKLAKQLTNLVKIVNDGFAKQAKFNKQQIAFNTRIEKEVLDLRHDVVNLRTDLNRVIKLNNLKH